MTPIHSGQVLMVPQMLYPTPFKNITYTVKLCEDFMLSWQTRLKHKRMKTRMVSRQSQNISICRTGQMSIG